MSDTIFALATAPGRSAVAVVRVSGPASHQSVAAIAGSVPPSRQAGLRKFRTAAGELIDEGLVLWFPGPGSYTGEDSAEFHLHGGVAVVEAMLDTMGARGLRLAAPGEFTRRAFENGRMDLAEAEAVADLIDAETTAQRRQALAQLGGALTARYDGWREQLLEALGWLEAEIDFPDEDLPEMLASRAGAPLAALAGELDRALEDLRGARVREGIRIALIGAPNAGKSSLLNRIADRDAAIVTPVPGTTRDVIEVPLTLSGYRVLIADTAGVRETSDLVEQEGVRRARAWAEGADLRLWVVDQAASGDWAEAQGLFRQGDVLVLSKADLAPGPDAGRARDRVSVADIVEADVLRPGGLDRLTAALVSKVEALAGGADFPAATRMRHRALLAGARDHLDRALAGASVGRPPELVAEDVRLAARSLQMLSGRIDAEAVLGRVFATFCIGK